MRIRQQNCICKNKHYFWALLFMMAAIFSYAPGDKVLAATDINVANYGALPDDGEEDGPAIRKAMDAAEALGAPANVIFSSGRYNVSPSPSKWEFETNGDFEGWTMLQDVSGAVYSGSLHLSVHGTQPYIHSPGNLCVEAGTLPFMKVSMKNDTASSGAKIYWTTNSDTVWNEAKSVSFAVYAGDDIFREYLVDFTSHAAWTGIIKQVRLDVENGNGSGTVNIDYIKLTGYPEKAWEFANDSDFEGWTMVNQVTGTVSGGNLHLAVNGMSPYIHSPDNLEIDAAQYSKMAIKMKNNTAATSGEIYWITNRDTTWDGNKKASFTINANDSDYSEYQISLSSNTLYWAQTIRQIRIVPENGAFPGNINIDYIKLIPSATEVSNIYNFIYKGLHGISLIGNNTEIISSDLLAGNFKFNNSSDITIRGISFDCQNAPFAQGVVTACDPTAGTFDFVPDAGYNYLLEDPRLFKAPSVWGTVRDPANPLNQKQTARDYIPVTGSVRMDSQTYRLTVPESYKICIGNTNQISVGDKFVLGVRGHGNNVINLRESTNVTVQDVYIYASPGVSLISYYSDGLVVNNLNVVRRNGRWITTNADGIHVQAARTGPEIGYSTFEGMQDDAIAIYSKPSFIYQVVSDTKVVVMSLGKVPLINDTVEIFNPKNGRVLGSAKVTNVEAVDGYAASARAMLTLDTAIPDMTAGNTHLTGDSVYNLSTAASGFHIHDNTFRELRSRGAYIKARNGTIRNNSFTKTSSAGIMVTNEPGSPNGPTASNIRIIDNTIDNCAYLKSYDSAATAAIRIEAQKYDAGHDIADSRAQQSIVVQGNTIIHPPRNGIYIAGAEDVQVTGANTMEAFAEDNVFNGDIAGVKLENAANIVINGLTIIDPRPELNAGIQIGSACDQVDIGTVSYSLAGGVPKIVKLALGAPTDLTASTANGERMYLDWADTPGAASYNVYCSTVPGFTPAWNNRVASGVTSSYYEDAGRSGAIVYYYKVTAVNAAGTESESSGQTSPPFIDNFEDGDATGWTNVGGTWSVITDGTKAYSQSATSGDILTYAGNALWTDYTAEARVKITGEGSGSTGTGLVFRHTDNSNYYWLDLRRSGNELRLMKKAGGAWSQVGTSVSLAQSLDTWYTLKVEIYGTTIKCYVDGAEKISATDAGLRSGRIGFRSFNTAARFDDIRVSFTPPLFTDNFEDGDATGWTNVGGAWSVITDGSKAYSQSATSGDVLTYAGNVLWSDYTAEARVKITGEGSGSTGTGLAFRYTDSSNYYWLNLRRPGNELRLMKKAGGAWSQVGSSVSLTQSLNTWYTLKVELYGTAIKCYVDGVEKINTTDASLSNGCIGFRSFNTAARFDDIRVSFVPPLFTDNFEDGDATGWANVGGTWSVITDGTKVYSQSATSGDVLTYGGNALWTDYTAEARVKITGEGSGSTGTGLAFRYTDSSNYYWLNLRRSGNELRLMKKAGGTWSQVGTSVSLAQSLDTWYTLKVELYGTAIKCYVDGAEKISVTDAGLSSGCIGFGSIDTAARFDDIRVSFVPPLFTDNFEDGDAIGWTNVGGTWSVITDGTKVYSQSATSGDVLTYAGNALWTDYTAEARVKITGEGSGSTGTGLVFRYTDSSNYYWLDLRRSSNELRLMKKAGGAWSQVGTSVSLAQSLDTWYTLKVELYGTAIKCYVDGAEKISVTDAGLSSGCIGFRSFNTAARFDDIIVRP